MGWRPSRTTTQYGTIPAGTDEKVFMGVQYEYGETYGETHV